jgi:cytochrome c-type biogenesis protein CcmH
MPMPVAIVRLTGEQLLNTNSPLTVTLDDSTAAMPTMRLSSLEQVNVVARISSKGQAMPQSGDLMGEQTAVNTRNDEKVTIEINKILP